MEINLQNYAEYVRALADKSVCKRRGVACMIVNRTNGETLGWNTNGPAGHQPDLCSGIKDGCGCAHSEVNTLVVARDTKGCLKGRSGLMIATRAPCVPCATAIVNCGYIGALVYLDASEPGDAGLAILKRFGISVSRYDDGHSQQDLRKTAVAAPSGSTEPCPGCGHIIVRGQRCPMCGS